MSDDAEKPEWRYFLRDNELLEIYRCPKNGKRLDQQRLEDVWIRNEDGTWSSNMMSRILDVIMKGWFNETTDEITEQQATDYYQKWKKSGKWPGGRCTWIDKNKPF